MITKAKQNKTTKLVSSIFGVGVKVKVSAVKASIKGYNKMTTYQRTKARAALSVDLTLKQLLWNCKSKALRDNKKFSLTLNDLQDAWKKQKGLCAYSDIPMQLSSGTRQQPNLYRVSVDRTINTLGYTRNNVKLVLWTVNQAKSTGDVKTMKTVSKAISKKFSRV